MMGFTVHIKKRHLVFLGILFGVVGLGFAIAAVPDPGHALGELDASDCSEGQIIVKNSAGFWECGNAGVGSGDIDAVVAGKGLSGGGTEGSVTLFANSGPGISILESTDDIRLKTVVVSCGGDTFLKGVNLDTGFQDCQTPAGSGGGGSGTVTQIFAGSGVTVSPSTSGASTYTVSATGTGGHGNGVNCGPQEAAIGVDANGNAEGCWTPSSTGGHGDGANCAAGWAAIGVDANGNAQGCFLPSGSGSNQNIIAGGGLGGGGSGDTVNLNVNTGLGIVIRGDNVELMDAVKTCPSGQAIRTFDLSADSAPTCVAVGGGLQNLFQRVQPSSGSLIIADSPTDTLTINGGGGVTVSGLSSTDTITISAAMQCRVEKLTWGSSGSGAAVACSSGFYATGGGGACPFGTTMRKSNPNSGIGDSPLPDGGTTLAKGWRVLCSGSGSGSVWAVCCKV